MGNAFAARREAARPFETLEKRILYAATAVTDVQAPAPTAAPSVGYHLTARPWQPSGVTTADYLDELEAVVRGIAPLQNAAGRIIDPVANREVQYSTPYFAFAVGVLL